MPICPICKGEEATRIAPGYWRCESLQDEEPCGYEYQAGATTDSTRLCFCETLAIGRCKQCGEWVCGDHSRLVGEKRLCLVHSEEADRELSQRHARESREAEKRLKVKSDEREAEERSRRKSRDRKELIALVATLAVAALLSASQGWPPALTFAGAGVALGTWVTISEMRVDRPPSHTKGDYQSDSLILPPLVGGALGALIGLALSAIF